MATRCALATGHCTAPSFIPCSLCDISLSTAWHPPGSLPACGTYMHPNCTPKSLAFPQGWTLQTHGTEHSC